MSRRSTPPLHSQGVSRIFQQSVQQLGQREGHGSMEGKKGLRQRDHDIKNSHTLNNYEERKFPVRNMDKLKTHREPVDCSSACNSKPVNIAPEQTCQRQQYRDKNRVMEVKPVASFVINHFAEDWTSDELSQETFDTNTLEYVPLNSTPKKQSKVKERNADMFDTASKCIRKNDEKFSQYLDPNNKEVKVSDRNVNNDNITHEKKLPVNLQSNQSVSNELNKVQTANKHRNGTKEEIPSVKEICHSFNGKKEGSGVFGTTGNSFSAGKNKREILFPTESENKENVCTRQTPMEVDVMSNDKYKSDVNVIHSSQMISGDASSSGEILEKDGEKPVIVTQENTSKIKPIQNGSKVISFLQKFNRKDRDRNGHDNVVVTSSRDYKHKSHSHDLNEAWRVKRSYKYNGNDSKCNWALRHSSYTYNRKNRHELKANLPPRLSKQFNHWREQNPHRSLCRSAIEKGKPKKKLLISNDQVKLVDICDKPVFSQRVGQPSFGLADSVHHSKETELIQNEEKAAKEELVVDSQYVKIHKRSPNVYQSCVIPCSEDWLAEISEEKCACVVQQDNIHSLNATDTMNKDETDRIRVDQTIQDGFSVGLKKQNTSESKSVCSAKHSEDKCLIAFEHEDYMRENIEDFEGVKSWDDGLKFDTNEHSAEKTHVDEVNNDVKLDPEQTEETLKDSAPYLPPPPSCPEYMYVSMKHVANTKENYLMDGLVDGSAIKDTILSGSEDHERQFTDAENENTVGTSYVVAWKDNIDNTEREDSHDKFISDTGADVSELLSDEVVDNISVYDTCSLNHSCLDMPDGPKSQENTIDYGGGNETSVDTATTQYTQWPLDHMTDNDYKSWLRFTYDSAYWNWYYYMCSKSIKKNMEWQTQAYNAHMKDVSKRKVQETGRTDKYEWDHVQEKTTGKHTEPTNIAPPSDLIADRTTSWVNSQVFHNSSSQTSTPQSQGQSNKSQKENAEHVRVHNYKPKTSIDNVKKTHIAVDVNDTERQHHYCLNSAESDETYSRYMNRDEGLRACFCSDRNIQYVTWRICYCGPPRLYGVYLQGDPNLDLGYWSYGSNTGTDQEEHILLDKGNGMLYQSPSPSEYQWVPGLPMKGKAVEKHHLYEDFVGGRDPTGFQQVYMLHSTAPEEDDKVRKRLSSDRLHADCTGQVHETDENCNNRQQVDRNPGKLRKIIEEMDKDGTSQASVENVDDARRGSGRGDCRIHATSEPISVNYKGGVFGSKQDMQLESLHSNTHLSEVEKNLTEAEEVNDKLGKSFFVMKNAISAIKQYTDQLKAKCDSSYLDTDNDLDRAECVIDKTDDLDSVNYTGLDQDSKDTNHDDFDQKEEKLGGSVRPKIRPFKFCAERRSILGCDSSSGHLSESSDDVCKESFLSQSPDTNSKADSYTHQFLRNQHRKNPKFSGVNESPRIIPRHIHSYRGGGSKCAVSGDYCIMSSDIGSWDRNDLLGPSSGKGPWNRTSPINHDTIKATSGQWHVEPSFPAYNMGYIENKYCNRDAWFDVPKHTDTTGPPTVSNITSKCKTPTKQTGSEKKDLSKTYKPWKPKLVDYTESGESSSDLEIEPFDVDSLSSDYNPSSVKEDSSNVSPVSQCNPKKWKYDNTVDNGSSSSYESSRVNSPVEFMARPQRKLSHRRLKSLSTGDVPPVTFVKAGTTHRKHQQHTATERKFKLHHRYNTEQDSVSTKSQESLSAFITSQRKSLPPISPFPQSQFWNMYLPKYNSALTGTQESISPKPDEKQDTRLPLTPEWRWSSPKTTQDRRNDTTVSQPDTDNVRTKKNTSDWRNTFKRFHSFGVKYIDTHCHLDFLFKREGFHGNLKDYMTQFPDTFPDTFEGCVAVFCNPLTFTPEGGLWKEVAKEDNVWFAMGCHPKNATDFTEAAEEGLQKCLQHSKCVALGEIGLDYSGTFQQHEEVQKMVFRKQLQIAVKMDKPLVIHCRQAEDDCLDILKEMVPKDHKIHCHCFTGYYYNAKLWLDAFPNLYIGVTPLVTYTTARPSHDLARNIPLNRLLLETDAPYFIPRSIPREDLQYSNPGLAITVAKEIAQYQELPVAAVLRHCRLNTKFMYGI